MERSRSGSEAANAKPLFEGDSMQPSSGRRGRPAPALTRLALTRPLAVLTAWLAAVAVLGAIGLGIDGRLSSSGLRVSDSESSRALALIGGNFDDSATVPILLRGPRAAVKTQGKALAAALAGLPDVRVLSPWTAASGRAALRPSADRALLLLSVSGSHADSALRSQEVQRLVAQGTSAPVRATVTGLPLLTRAGTQSSLAAVHRSELIALPLLLLALLFVFRSLLAAAIPAAFGAATIASSTGALALLAAHVRFDAFALAISCMVGLALAVDYSLLLVSRLREELAEHRGGDIRAAVARAAAPTTRTVAAAAAVIVVAMGVAATMSPGTALLAAALGVSVVALLSAATAMLAVPAMLVLVGHRLDRRAPATAAGPGASARLARAATRRPALGVLVALLLLATCVPVLGLRTGAPAAASLPSGSPARAQYDSVSEAMGPGWTEPFEIVAVTRRGAVTTPQRLAQLARVQRELARDPAVAAVLGPGSIAPSAARLRSAGRRAAAAQRALPRRTGGRLRRLDAGMSSAADGVTSLRSSLSSANTAATRVAAGSRDIQGGVGALKTGLNGAGSGARRLAARLADAGRGASGLASRSAAAVGGARDLRNGARKLSSGLGALAGNARDLKDRLRQREDALDRARAGVRAQRHQTDDVLAAAERSLPPVGSAALQAHAALHQARQALAADAAAGLDEPLRQLGLDAEYAGAIATAMPVRDAGRLATSVDRLADGADVITRRVRGLSGTVGALTAGTGSLVGALEQLDGGAGRIGTAFGAVRAGVDGLASGVRTGERRTGELASGLDSARSAVRGLRGPATGTGRETPQAANAGFFDSGYFLLAALESGTVDAPFGLNVGHGGQGARIVVVPRYAASDRRTKALYERLRATSARLGVELGAESAVGGPAAVLADYDDAVARRLPLIVLVLTLVTALLLAILLRSILVPIIGVALNLLAVGATLGLLALLFQGDAPVLGGPGEIDGVALTAIFGVVFALSIDYQVFIVSRVREEWLRCGDEARAVHVGLARTARVVTGAALSMLGVFVAFALADVASLRQFGVGLAIAVVIDATLVRLVLLPAALRLAGRWAWWTPSLKLDDPISAAPCPAIEPARSG
jgi:RND superfamily putative drug exporter